MNLENIGIMVEPEQPELAALYARSSLELGEDWASTAVYSPVARLEHALLGAATVSRRGGRAILDFIAVVPEARGSGLGRRLAECCLRWCREQGETELWLAARTPGFFRSLGAQPTGGTALLEDCLCCPDYRRGCQPMEMKFRL